MMKAVYITSLVAGVQVYNQAGRGTPSIGLEATSEAGVVDEHILDVKGLKEQATEYRKLGEDTLVDAKEGMHSQTHTLRDTATKTATQLIKENTSGKLSEASSKIAEKFIRSLSNVADATIDKGIQAVEKKAHDIEATGAGYLHANSWVGWTNERVLESLADTKWSDLNPDNFSRLAQIAATSEPGQKVEMNAMLSRFLVDNWQNAVAETQPDSSGLLAYVYTWVWGPRYLKEQTPIINLMHSRELQTEFVASLTPDQTSELLKKMAFARFLHTLSDDKLRLLNYELGTNGITEIVVKHSDDSAEDIQAAMSKLGVDAAHKVEGLEDSAFTYADQLTKTAEQRVADFPSSVDAAQRQMQGKVDRALTGGVNSVKDSVLVYAEKFGLTEDARELVNQFPDEESFHSMTGGAVDALKELEGPVLQSAGTIAKDGLRTLEDTEGVLKTYGHQAVETGKAFAEHPQQLLEGSQQLLEGSQQLLEGY